MSIKSMRQQSNLCDAGTSHHQRSCGQVCVWSGFVALPLDFMKLAPLKSVMLPCNHSPKRSLALGGLQPLTHAASSVIATGVCALMGVPHSPVKNKAPQRLDASTSSMRVVRFICTEPCTPLPHTRRHTCPLTCPLTCQRTHTHPVLPPNTKEQATFPVPIMASQQNSTQPCVH